MLIKEILIRLGHDIQALQPELDSFLFSLSQAISHTLSSEAKANLKELKSDNPEDILPDVSELILSEILTQNQPPPTWISQQQVLDAPQEQDIKATRKHHMETYLADFPNEAEAINRAKPQLVQLLNALLPLSRQLAGEDASLGFEFLTKIATAKYLYRKCLNQKAQTEAVCSHFQAQLNSLVRHDRGAQALISEYQHSFIEQFKVPLSHLKSNFIIYQSQICSVFTSSKDNSWIKKLEIQLKRSLREIAEQDKHCQVLVDTLFRKMLKKLSDKMNLNLTDVQIVELIAISISEGKSLLSMIGKNVSINMDFPKLDEKGLFEKWLTQHKLSTESASPEFKASLKEAISAAIHVIHHRCDLAFMLRLILTELSFLSASPTLKVDVPIKKSVSLPRMKY